MKTLSSRSPHSTILAQLSQYAWGLRAPSLTVVAFLILALVQRENVWLTKLALEPPGAAKRASKVKQLHRFFKHLREAEDVLASVVLSFATGDERLLLVMDRTNWRLGTINLNILLYSSQS